MSLNFKWSGDPISVDVEDKQLTSKPKTYYSKCVYQGTEYNIGDAVLISNAEADDPESIAHCYVAAIVFMYEMKSNKKDPFRAQVQWYSRVEQLPTRIRKWDANPPLNEEWEVVDEGQRFKGDISIETIFGKCSIIKCQADEIPSSKIGKVAKNWVFFCRFALGPKNAKCFFPVDGFSSPVKATVKVEPVTEEPRESDPLPGTPKASRRSIRTPARYTGEGVFVPKVEPRTEEKKENEPLPGTPKSSRRGTRTPARYNHEDALLPSPLKNATFSIKKNSKELCVVIQRCDKSVKKEADEEDFVKIKARKKLDLETLDTPSRQRENEKTPKKIKRSASGDTPVSKKKLKMTPSLSSRKSSIAEPSSPLGEIRRRLHVSAVPHTLPCREEEFNYIFEFVHGKLSDGSGGCMYVSGVPGTGKTATVSEVVRLLREQQAEGDLPDFKLVEVNGMKLTTPQQIYVHIWNQLTGNKVSADKAVKLLQAKFSSNGPRHLPTVLIVDELDLLWTRQQDVLYNIFEWPNRPKAQLTVLAIANTMDLPERMLMNKVASRMGLTRLIFQPYKVKQLQTIISSRLENTVMFEPEAVEFIARKVSAASGDARRALDIARRAAELAEIIKAKKSPSKKGTASSSKSTVAMQHVQSAIEEMFSSPKLLAIQACSVHEQMFLNALVQEYNRTGVEESIFYQVIKQHYTLCDLDGVPRPTISELLAVCASLSSSRLILSEHGRNDICQKLHLNVSIDDVTYALKGN